MISIDLTAAPQTDPTVLYRARDGLYATDLLVAALVHLDFFSWVAERGDAGVTEEAVAGHFQIVPRMVDVMTTLFRAQGLLRTAPDRTLHLTPMAAEHLVVGSTWCLAPYYAPLQDRAGVIDLLQVMRSGRPVLWSGQQEDREDWHHAMEDETFAGRFTATMDCRGVLLGPAAARGVDLSHHSRLLDVAGGSGIYACAFADRHPHLTATVLEKPPVDAMAAQLIARRGFASRVSVLTADMMDGPLPANHDVHLWSNVLHDWDVPEVLILIGASWAALPPGGMFIMHDAFLNEAKDGPLHVAEYSVTLAHATQGRCYSVSELRTWLTAAGFTDISHHDTIAGRGLMTARKPSLDGARGAGK